MSGWILLIPPSENKAVPPEDAPIYSVARENGKLNSFDQLDDARMVVWRALVGAIDRGSGLESLFEVTGASLNEAVAWNRRAFEAPALPARDVYTGVMYEAIGFPSLKATERKLFDKNTLIVSALFGLLRPGDLIPPYKLKMGASIGGRVGKPVSFWRRPVSEILRREVRGKVVWDFLPDQHRRVWDSTGEFQARHQVKFVKRIIRSGVAEYKTISHHAKSLKGALIRHLLSRNATEPADLFDFTHPDGYVYDRDQSVISSRESLLVFASG